MNGLHSSLSPEQVPARVASTRFLAAGLLGRVSGRGVPAPLPGPGTALPAPPSAGDGTVEGCRVDKFFPRTRGYLGITAVPDGFMRSSIRGGPPDKREMDESMARMVAAADGTKYSEYPALSSMADAPLARKNFVGCALPCVGTAPCVVMHGVVMHGPSPSGSRSGP